MSSSDVEDLVEADSLAYSSAMKFTTWNDEWIDISELSMEFGMDYQSLLEQIRGNWIEKKDTTGLVMIAYISEMKRKGEALGANAQLSKPEIGNLIKVVDELVNELKEAIGSKITVEFPAKGDVEIEVTKLSDDDQFVFYNGKNQFTGAPEEKKYLIGMLMTDKAFEIFYNLMEPKLKENKINAEKAAEEKRIADEKAASEKRSTYENEEVQKFIKSLPIGLIGDYTWNKRPLPNEWKQEFSEQPENIKIGFSSRT